MNYTKVTIGILVVVVKAPLLFPYNFRAKHELKPGISWHGKDLAVYQTCPNNQEYATEKYAKELNPLMVLPQGIQDTIVGMVMADKFIAVDCPWWENQGENKICEWDGNWVNINTRKDNGRLLRYSSSSLSSNWYAGNGLCSDERTSWVLMTGYKKVICHIDGPNIELRATLDIDEEHVTDFSLDSQCKFYVFSNKQGVVVQPLKLQEKPKLFGLFDVGNCDLQDTYIACGNLLTLPIEHTGLVSKICVSPDGRKIFVKFTDSVQEVFSVKSQGKTLEIKRLYNSKMMLKDYLTCKGVCKK